MKTKRFVFFNDFLQFCLIGQKPADCHQVPLYDQSLSLKFKVDFVILGVRIKSEMSVKKGCAINGRCVIFVFHL